MPSKAELKAVEEDIFGKDRVQKSAVGKANQCKEYVKEESENYMKIRSTVLKLSELVENGLSIATNYGVSTSLRLYRDMIDSLEDFIGTAGLNIDRFPDEEQLKYDIESEYMSAHEED